MTANRIYIAQRDAAKESQARMVSGVQYLSTPDHADFVLTDLDVSWFGSIDQVQNNDQTLLCQWNTTGSQRSWTLRYGCIANVQQAKFYISIDGAANFVNADHSAQFPIQISAGTYFGLRATRRQSDGETKIYFSATDPPTWQLLHTTTLSPGSVLKNSTALVQAGGAIHIGYFRRAEIRNGYDGVGSLISSPNVTTLSTPYGITTLVDGQGKIWTTTGGPFVSKLAEQTLAKGYLSFPGRSGDYAQWTRSSISSLTPAVLEFRVHVLFDSLTADNIRPYSWVNGFTGMKLRTSRALGIWNGSGSEKRGDADSPSTIPGLTTGTWIWLRAKLTSATALCEYWYSYDASNPTWISLGSATGVNPQPLCDTANSGWVNLGGQTSASPLAGRIDYAAEYHDGVMRFEWDLANADVLPNPVVISQTAGVWPVAYFQPRQTEVAVNDLWKGEKRQALVNNGHIRHRGADSACVCLDTSVGNFTGDLDVRWFGVLDDWTHATQSQALIAKYQDFGSDNRSWMVRSEAGSVGARLWASANGTSAVASTPLPIPFTDGQPGGIRFTRVKTTGVTTCWFSTDGETWEPQTPTSVLLAGSSLFASTNMLNIGAYNDGLSSRISPGGKTFWAEVRNGIDGPVVFRVGPKTFSGQGRDAWNWTCETGQTIEFRGFPDLRLYPHVDADNIVDIYQGDTRLWPGADGYVSTYGTAGNYLQVQASTDLDSLTTGFTQIVKVRRHGGTWTPVAPEDTHHITHKAGSMTFYLGVDGWGGTAICPVIVWVYNNGANWSWHFGDPLPNTDDWVWVAVTYLNTNPGLAFRFWISSDGVNWTQSGALRSDSNPMTIPSSTSSFRLLANPDNNDYSNIDMAYCSLSLGCGAGGAPGGTEKFRMDRDSFKIGRRATTLSAKLRVPNYINANIGRVTTPDPGVPPDAFTLVGEFGEGAAPSAGTLQYLATHSGGTGTLAWHWSYVQSSRNVRVQLSTDGTGSGTVFSVVGPTRALNDRYFIASSMEKLATQWRHTLYSSSDGIAWTNMGNVLVTFGTIFDTSVVLNVGQSSTSVNEVTGKVYGVKMVTGLDPASGTVLWQCDPKEYTSGLTWTDARSRVWTLTVAGTVILNPIDPTNNALTLFRGGATPLSLYPTVSEMQAKWGVSQYSDGTKWSA